MKKQLQQLQGNVALLFGATNKVSATTARMLAKEGVHLALLDQSDARLQALAQSLRHQGVVVSSAVVDPAHPTMLPDRVKEVLRPHGGRVDVLVNTMGHYPMVLPKNPTWRDLFQIALIGYLSATMEILPRMSSQRKGMILNVVPDLTCCSFLHPMHLRLVEDSVLVFSMDLAEEAGSSGIRQAFVASRPFLTRIWAHQNDILDVCARVNAWLSESTLRAINGYQGVVLPRLMGPEKIARLLVALLLPKDKVSTFVPGEHENHKFP
jgi:short-subunit dehydrogenase